MQNSRNLPDNSAKTKEWLTRQASNKFNERSKQPYKIVLESVTKPGNGPAVNSFKILEELAENANHDHAEKRGRD